MQIDESIFPVAEFKGQWNEGDPPEWEDFSICLFGLQAGDMITDPSAIYEALLASGYKLTLEKIEAE